VSVRNRAGRLQTEATPLVPAEATWPRSCAKCGQRMGGRGRYELFFERAWRFPYGLVAHLPRKVPYR
jgi:hypothetical protein